MTPIYSYISEFETGPKCLGIVLFIATIPCIVSSFSALVLSPLDKRRKRILKLDKRNEFTSSSERSVRFVDTFKFPPQIWLLIIICVCFYSVTFPFISLGKLFFIRKYDCNPYVASLQQRQVSRDLDFGMRTNLNVCLLLASQLVLSSNSRNFTTIRLGRGLHWLQPILGAGFNPDGHCVSRDTHVHIRQLVHSSDNAWHVTVLACDFLVANGLASGLQAPAGNGLWTVSRTSLPLQVKAHHLMHV